MRQQRSHSAAPVSGPRATAAGVDRYENVRMLGKGSYGKVYLVRDRQAQENLVMKVIDLTGMSKHDRAEALSEAETLQRITHPHIIRYVDSFVSGSRTLHIVTEHAAKGDLERLISSRMGRRLQEEAVARLFSQICSAVNHLHERHILHRDLKPANIFIAGDGSAKIGDFGLAKVLAHTMQCAKTACGTPYYMAPEICQERPYHNRSDVWALGCILFNMASGGRHPFDARDLKELFRKISHGQPDQLPSSVSTDLRQLIAQLLQRDPLARPPVSQILASPFLSRHGHGSGGTPPPPVASRAPSEVVPAPRRGTAAAAGPSHLHQMAALGRQPAAQAPARPPATRWAAGGLPMPPPAPPQPSPAPRGRLDPIGPIRAPRRVPPPSEHPSCQPQWWHSEVPAPPPQRRRHMAGDAQQRQERVMGRVDYAAMLGAQRAELEEREAQFRNWRAARPTAMDRADRVSRQLPPLSRPTPQHEPQQWRSEAGQLPPLPSYARA